MEEFPDQSHDVWNDVRNALRDTGLWNHVLVMVLALNLSHGPYEEGSWHETLCGAFKEYHRLAGPQDPTFLRLLPKILADLGQSHRLAAENTAQEVWDNLPDAWCWQRRGAKVGLCRFFGYVTSSSPYQAIYHTKLLAMIYLGLQQGWLEKQALKAALSKTLKVKDTGTDKKQSMKESKKQVSKLFGYGNTVQLVTIAKLEPDTYFYQNMVGACTGPLSKWHSHQNKTLRSCSEAGKWFLEQTGGGFLLPVCETFAILWDKRQLQQMGFTFSSSQPAGLDHPTVVVEDQWAQKTLSFTLNLAGNRIKRCFWAMRGWPAQGCQLGHRDPKKRESAINALRADYDGYHRCERKAPHFFCEENLSVFETRPVQQIVEMFCCPWRPS